MFGSHDRMSVAMMRRTLATLSLLLALSGCKTLSSGSGPDGSSSTEPNMPVIEQALSKSAAAVAESLNRLAMIEQKRTPVKPNGSAYTPDMPPEMQTPITLTWVGPAEQVAEIVTRQIGWQFRVFGNRGPTPIVVTIDSKEAYAVDVLRDIGLQITGSGAVLVLDGAASVVEFRYQGR